MGIYITEEVTDNRQHYDCILHRVGYVRYTYRSPTHWSSSGLCNVTAKWDWDGNLTLELNWASGGVNSGFTNTEIADAMSKAFALASNRLTQLEQEYQSQEAL